MNIKDAVEIFNRIKGSCEIKVLSHAYLDHPKRKFTVDELLKLVREAKRISKPVMPSAPKDSFLIRTMDDKGKKCEIGILFKGNRPNEIIIVIHAFR